MSIRLNKVTKECNVGLQTAVEFLQKKGFSDVEANPNTKISDEQYQMLVAEFKKDKGLRDDAAIISRKRQHKEKKATIALPEEKPVEIKTATEAKLGKGPKVVGRIDLDNLGARKSVAAPEKKDTPAPARPAEVKAEAPVAEPAPKQEEKPQAEKESLVVQEPVRQLEKSSAIGTETDGVFRLNHTAQAAPQLKVKGHIDLAALNQSTRPKKKTKEEKRKEREEKNRQAGGDRSRQGGTGQNASEGKKKRVRIGKERVDVNAVAGQQNGKKRDNAPGANQQGGGKHNKNKNRQQPVIKAEVSDEDVAKQVKETLARLTNKSKAGKGAKYRKEKRENARASMEEQLEEQAAESKVLKLTEFVTANELAVMMDVPVTQVISTCMSIGIMVSINQRLDAETINLVAEEFGFKTEYVSAEVSEAVNEEEDDEEDLVPRAPIVTVMGHVDHGKTSLLDYIRKTNVIAGEAGGITQHIGAYNVTLESGRHITFLDTPGHEAFTAMRARGAKVTDIVILIVAADDGVMPQTVESINHAKAANVKLIVAMNKMDKPTANPERVMEGLTKYGIITEDWGGDVACIPVSALTGMGINDLLERIALEAEVMELKANPNRRAKGAVVEARLDKGQGPIATILVQNGTLHSGDVIIAGTAVGRVRTMRNDKGQLLSDAGPSTPVEITGLTAVPEAGDLFEAVEDERLARELAEQRIAAAKEKQFSSFQKVTLDNLFSQMAQNDMKELAIVVKADVQGSAEAVKQSLEKISNDEVRVRVIHAGVGAISKSDVDLADASNAIIIGFNVRPDNVAKEEAAATKVEMRMYRVIYDAINDVTDAMKGMLAPKFREISLGELQVRQVYKISNVGTVAGCRVTSGKITRDSKVRVVRDGIVIAEDEIASLKRFKDDAKEVAEGYECGVTLEKFADVKEGDVYEAFKMEEYRD